MSGPWGFNADGIGYCQDDTNLRVYRIGCPSGTPELENIPAGEFLSDLGARRTSSLVVVESTIQHDCIVNFGATRESIERIRQGWEIPSVFLAKISKPGSLSCFVHHVEHSTLSADDNQEATSLNMGLRWGQGHGLWMVVFGRYNLKTRTLRVVVSSRKLLQESELEGLLRERLVSLQGDPLGTFRILFEICGQYVDSRTQKYFLHMTSIANSLNISNRDWALWWGMRLADATSTERMDNLSKDIYQALSYTRWLYQASQQLVEIGDRCSEVILATAAGGNSPLQRQATLTCDQTTDILHRISLNHHLLLYIEHMLQSQFQLHQNLMANQEAKATGRIAVASQRDSLSMKTVSYLTLIFLPATFVSAVFSTTVFDFQNWNRGGGEPGTVASPGWWIYLICCALATIVTISIWLVWHRGDLRRWERVNRSSV